MKNLKSRFANIRRKIRRGDKETSIDLLSSLQEDVEAKIIRYLEIIESHNKVAGDVKHRYIEYQRAEGKTHRLTVNSVTGRVTLKIADQASETVRADLEIFAEYARSYLHYPLFTMRGKIAWSNHHQCYLCTLYSQGKHKKVTLAHTGKPDD